MSLLYHYNLTNFTICVVLFVGAGLVFFAGLITFFVMLSKKSQKLGKTLALFVSVYLTIFIPTILHYGNKYSEYAPEAYEDALEFYTKYEYAAARKLFELIPDYSDSAKLARECSHNSARYYIENGRYVDAMGQLYGYTDDSEGGKLFKTAEDALVTLNASDGLDNLLDMPGKWDSEGGQYYLSMTEKNGGLRYETNIIRNPYEPLFKYKFRSQNGILKANLETGNDSVAAFQNEDNNHTTAYFYSTGKVIKFVRQQDE